MIRSLRVVAGAILMIVGGFVTQAQVRDVKPVTDAMLLNPDPADWPNWRRTLDGWGYSPLTQINRNNVAQLRMVWGHGLGSGNQEGTPLVWNDTIYAITSWSVVVALDARTGKERWRWDPEVNQDAVRPKICCGAVNLSLIHI